MKANLTILFCYFCILLRLAILFCWIIPIIPVGAALAIDYFIIGEYLGLKSVIGFVSCIGFCLWVFGTDLILRGNHETR